MKRCNNCGWYNQDSVVSCVKCQDTSFKSMVEAEPNEGSAVSETAAEQVAKSPVMATVSFCDQHKFAPQCVEDKRKYSATVLDAGSVLPDNHESSCHKCRYPLVGNVDCCPNCGTPIRGNVPVPRESATHEAKSADVSNLKATVRDVADCVQMDEAESFKLIPIEEPSGESYKMHLGDIIVIGGKRYRFQK